MRIKLRGVPPELLAVGGVILWVLTLGLLEIEMAYADNKGKLRCCIKLNSWLKRS